MSRPRGWAAAAAAAGAFVLLATACGGRGLSSDTPSQVLSAARTAVQNASSYEISGTGDFGSGIDRLDFTIVGTNLSGSFTESGSTVLVMVVDGNVYLKAPAVFYTSDGVSSAEATVLASTWVEATAGSAVASDFSSLSALTDIAAELPATGTLASAGTGTVDGQSVVILRDQGDATTLAVAASGAAYPVQMKRTGSTTTEFDLSHWNSAPAFTAPPSPLTLPSS
jgi:hypothetical protein